MSQARPRLGCLRLDNLLDGLVDVLGITAAATHVYDVSGSKCVSGGSDSWVSGYGRWQDGMIGIGCQKGTS